MFKAGDKVKRINGDKFSNLEYIATIDRIEGSSIWLKETCTYINDSSIELALTSEQSNAINVLKGMREKLADNNVQLKKQLEELELKLDVIDQAIEMIETQ